MIRSNRGATSLKRRRHRGDKMREFDGLPAELRVWVASAILPWRPRSVLRAFERAFARTHCTDRALSELDRIERNLIARDVRKVWGTDHPAASARSRP